MRPLSPHTRRVHQVRLSAPSQDLIWRGRNLLEDALHTVSLPAAETSQLLFIRHFDVGTIHSNQSSTSLSLSLAARLQQLSEIAIPGTHPAAAQAPAVIFPDDLAAYAHFAYRLATGQSLQAWFWPHLLPEWHPTHSTHETICCLLVQLANHAIAPLATATVLHQLQQQRALTSFLAVLQLEDGHDLLAQNGWHAPAAATLTDNEVSPIRQSLPIFSPAQPQRWTAEDPRTLWLTALGLIAERSTMATAPDLIAIAHQKIQSALTNAEPGHTSTSQASGVQRLTSTPVSNRSVTASPAANPVPQSQPQSPPSPAPSSPVETVSPKENSSSPTLPKIHSESSSFSPALPPPLSQPTPFPDLHTPVCQTEYAGLVYLLNLFTYLHLSAYLPQYNNPTFPHLLLRYIAYRLGVPEGDPIFTVFANDEVALDSFIPQHSSLINPLTAWYSALRRWLRRHTPFTLKTLIHRPGTLALTPTHLDLTFDLTQVDIHIRRAGLDVNPGWLPWFGRVVQFHYETSREASYQAFCERGDTP